MAAMELRLLIYSILAMLVAGCETNSLRSRARATLASPEITLEQFESNAAAFHSVVELPVFETSSNEMAVSVQKTIKEADSMLDRIGKLSANEANFSNTVRALAQESFLTSITENRLTIIEKTATNDAVRDAAAEQLDAISGWDIGSDYRHDVYRAIKAFANTRPRLKGEDARLLQITIRDLRRVGLELPKPQQKEVEDLRERLSGLSGKFDDNAATAEAPVVFTREELEGLPEDFLEQPGLKNSDGKFTLMANVAWHCRMVAENAKR